MILYDEYLLVLDEIYKKKHFHKSMDKFGINGKFKADEDHPLCSLVLSQPWNSPIAFGVPRRKLSVHESEIDRAVPTPGRLARFGCFRTLPRQNIRRSIKTSPTGRLCTESTLNILDYVLDSAALQSESYRGNSTLKVTSIPNPANYSSFNNMLEARLGRVANSCLHSCRKQAVTDFNDIVRLNERVPIPHGIITYLNHRNAGVLNQFLCNDRISLLLWSSFATTLFHSPSSPQAPHSIQLDEVKTALWALAQIKPTLPTYLRQQYTIPFLGQWKPSQAVSP
ncbi:hypothetical protein K438DRAFT_1756109 [Mycena galopus ATCC 62051]|nr:hypothetical protein K438DRAFT_1756109 [Mycena galopus ATCC 62051]